MTRLFILTAAPSPTALLDRAAAHGDNARVVAHAAPHPGADCYGAIEIVGDNETEETTT